MDGNATGEGAAPANETKEQKFKRLIQQRLANVDERMEQLGKLFNKKDYDFTQTNVDNVVATLQGMIDAIKKKAADALAPAAEKKSEKKSYAI